MKKEEIIELIDEVDDEHLILFRRKYSQVYIHGWIDALERLKKKLKKLKKMKKENNPVHRNSCGEPIYDKHGNIAICCGDDLGGDNGEFAQCEKCREKDYTDVGMKKENKCFKCGKPIPKATANKNICRVCFENPRTKHKGQLTQKANKMKKENKFKETEECGDYEKLQEERENKSLSEKIFAGPISKNQFLQTEDVKEKIQNVQRRIKGVINRGQKISEKYCTYEEQLINEIDKIFLEEIGRKLI